jgi:hypothetical protein
LEEAIYFARPSPYCIDIKFACSTHEGDALGCRVFLGGVIVPVFLLLHSGFSGGNSRSSMGSGEGDALASLFCRGLALDVPPVGGTSGELWWLVSASFSSSTWRCAALGLAWTPKRWLRDFASAVLRRGVRVSTLVAWVTWSSTRVGTRPQGRCGCRSGGSGILPPPSRVEVLGYRPWSFARLGHRLVCGPTSKEDLQCNSKTEESTTTSREGILPD